MGVDEDFQGIRVRVLRAGCVLHPRRPSRQDGQACEEQHKIFAAKPVQVKRDMPGHDLLPQTAPPPPAVPCRDERG